MPTHIEQPLSRHSRPASRKIRCRPSASACAFTAPEPGEPKPGAVAPFEVLDEVAQAVGDRLEILIDGGIRRGTNVVKALALGARARLVGRPYLYGLAAGGQPGVEHALEIFRSEIRNLANLVFRYDSRLAASCADFRGPTTT